MAKNKTIREITLDDIRGEFQLGSYWFGDTWCPAVDEKNGGYQIRVVKNEYRHGADTTTNYDYFYLDADGLVTGSPRGYAKDYTRTARVTDIAKECTRWEVPDESATRLRLPF